jgi:hypothetical protein
MNRPIIVSRLLFIALALAIAACGKQDPEPRPGPKAASQPAKKHDCDDTHGKPAGPAIELGTGPCGTFTVKASRDNFPIKAGCDAPIDAWVTGAGKVSAIRFWIGTEDAKGAIKSRAEVENPLDPDHWHAHAEIPDPIPEGSKIWIEIEEKGGAKSACSFAMKN